MLNVDQVPGELVTAIETAFAPAEAARLQRVYSLIRDKIIAGAFPVTLRLPNGELVSPSIEELRAHFPDAGDDRISLPRLGNVPARVLINLCATAVSASICWGTGSASEVCSISPRGSAG